MKRVESRVYIRRIVLVGSGVVVAAMALGVSGAWLRNQRIQAAKDVAREAGLPVTESELYTRYVGDASRNAFTYQRDAASQSLYQLPPEVPGTTPEQREKQIEDCLTRNAKFLGSVTKMADCDVYRPQLRNDLDSLSVDLGNGIYSSGDTRKRCFESGVEWLLVRAGISLKQKRFGDASVDLERSCKLADFEHSQVGFGDAQLQADMSSSILDFIGKNAADLSSTPQGLESTLRLVDRVPLVDFDKGASGALIRNGYLELGPDYIQALAADIHQIRSAPTDPANPGLAMPRANEFLRAGSIAGFKPQDLKSLSNGQLHLFTKKSILRLAIAALALHQTPDASRTTDPFSGKPLKVLTQKGGWLLYSVGCDGFDDKGEMNDKSSGNYDITFQLKDGHTSLSGY